MDRPLLGNTWLLIILDILTKKSNIIWMVSHCYSPIDNSNQHIATLWSIKQSHQITPVYIQFKRINFYFTRCSFIFKKYMWAQVVHLQSDSLCKKNMLWIFCNLLLYSCDRLHFPILILLINVGSVDYFVLLLWGNEVLDDQMPERQTDELSVSF